MRWILAFHIISMVAWFAGLFYLPRLFVYHAETTDDISVKRFKIMERRLYYAITTPAAILTSIFGFWLLSFHFDAYIHMPWMDAKLFLVLLLFIYHIYCGVLVHKFKHDTNTYSQKFYRFFNEAPTVLLISIIILVVIQP